MWSVIFRQLSCFSKDLPVTLSDSEGSQSAVLSGREILRCAQNDLGKSSRLDFYGS